MCISGPTTLQTEPFFSKNLVLPWNWNFVKSPFLRIDKFQPPIRQITELSNSTVIKPCLHQFMKCEIWKIRKIVKMVDPRWGNFATLHLHMIENFAQIGYKRLIWTICKLQLRLWFILAKNPKTPEFRQNFKVSDREICSVMWPSQQKDGFGSF